MIGAHVRLCASHVGLPAVTDLACELMRELPEAVREARFLACHRGAFHPEHGQIPRREVLELFLFVRVCM